MAHTQITAMMVPPGSRIFVSEHTVRTRKGARTENARTENTVGDHQQGWLLRAVQYSTETQRQDQYQYHAAACCGEAAIRASRRQHAHRGCGYRGIGRQRTDITSGLTVAAAAGGHAHCARPPRTATVLRAARTDGAAA